MLASISGPGTARPAASVWTAGPCRRRCASTTAVPDLWPVHDVAHPQLAGVAEREAAAVGAVRGLSVEQALAAEQPVHGRGGERVVDGVFDGLERSPRAAPVDRLGLVEAVDRFGQRVVVAVADAADRRIDPGFGQAPGVFDREVLDTADALMFVKHSMGP